MSIHPTVSALAERNMRQAAFLATAAETRIAAEVAALRASGMSPEVFEQIPAADRSAVASRLTGLGGTS